MAKRLLNLDDMDVKRGLMTEISRLKGLWDVELKARKQTRSLDANRYYWAAIATVFSDWLTEEWGETVSPEQAHEMLKHKILGYDSKEVGGLKLYLPRTTTKLDVSEFSDYIERCIQWLAEFCQIAVVPSDLFYHGASEGKPKS